MKNKIKTEWQNFIPEVLKTQISTEKYAYIQIDKTQETEKCNQYERKVVLNLFDRTGKLKKSLRVKLTNTEISKIFDLEQVVFERDAGYRIVITRYNTEMDRNDEEEKQ